jgi:GGDEF domain-containing protein
MLVETDATREDFRERILKEIENRKWFEDDISEHIGAKVVIPTQSRIGCSAGIANYYFDLTSNASDLDIDAAIEKSERAMRSAKAEGKNRVAVWEGF